MCPRGDDATGGGSTAGCLARRRRHRAPGGHETARRDKKAAIENPPTSMVPTVTASIWVIIPARIGYASSALRAAHHVLLPRFYCGASVDPPHPALLRFKSAPFRPIG